MMHQVTLLAAVLLTTPSIVSASDAPSDGGEAPEDVPDTLAPGKTWAPHTQSPRTLAPFPSTGAPATSAPHTLSPLGIEIIKQWCTTNTTCQEDGDAGGWCNPMTWRCGCTSGYGPGMDMNGNKLYWGCYEDMVKVVVGLEFADGNCTDNEVPLTTRQFLVTQMNSQLSGTVKAAIFICGSIHSVLVADVPAKVADSLTPSKIASDLLAAVTGSDANGVVLGSTLTASVRKAAPGGVGSCQLEYTMIAETVTVGNETVCTAVQCNDLYVLIDKASQPGFDCIAKLSNHTDTSCIVDGDCSAYPDYVCVSGNCNAPTPAPTKVTAYVKKTSSLAADWCISDEDCRLGDFDPLATCTMNSELGNYCTCVTASYAYPAAGVNLCLPSGVTSIPMNFFVSYIGGNLSQFDSAEQALMTTALQTVFGGQLDDGIDATAGNGLFLFGSISVSAARLAEFVSGAKTILAELNRATGDSAGRFASVLSSGGANGAGASNGKQCDSEYATRTQLDSANVCQAVDCQEIAYRVSSGSVYRCTLRATSRDISDDDLSDSDYAALGLGIGFGVLIVILGVVLYFVCRKTPQQSAKPDHGPDTEA